MSKKPLNFRFDSDIVKRFKDYAKSKGLKQTQAFIAMLNEVTKGSSESQPENKYDFLEQLCPSLVYLYSGDEKKEGWYCIKNPPNQKRLGDGSDHDARKICMAHKKMQGLLEEHRTMKDERERGVLIQLPYCTKKGPFSHDGSPYSDDGKKMYCPMEGKYVDLKTCKTLRIGVHGTPLPCQHYRATQIRNIKPPSREPLKKE